jgi:hypothetical protein
MRRAADDEDIAQKEIVVDEVDRVHARDLVRELVQDLRAQNTIGLLIRQEVSKRLRAVDRLRQEELIPRRSAAAEHTRTDGPRREEEPLPQPLEIPQLAHARHRSSEKPTLRSPPHASPSSQRLALEVRALPKDVDELTNRCPSRRTLERDLDSSLALVRPLATERKPS